MSLEGNAKMIPLLVGKIKGIPKVDNTLSKEGQCADAKAVGDRFIELEKRMDDMMLLLSNATEE